MTSIGPSQQTRPESIALLLKLWLAVVAAECLHQVMNVVKGILDPSELKTQGRESVSGMYRIEPTEQQLTFAVYFSLVVSALIAMAIMAIVAYGAWRLYKRQGYAENMRRMLLFFGVYLAFRGITPFLMVPQAAVPAGVTLFDGYLQILIAVAASIAAILGSKAESLDWARGANQPAN